MLVKKLWLVSLILLTLSAPALTNQEKLDAIEVAKNKYYQLSELDKLQAFQYLYLKFCEHTQEIAALKHKVEDHEAKLK
jgi:hypothetical protein